MALMFEGVTSAFGPTAGPALNEWLVNFTLAQHELLGWCSQYALVRLCVCVCVCACVCVCVCVRLCVHLPLKLSVFISRTLALCRALQPQVLGRWNKSAPLPVRDKDYQKLNGQVRARVCLFVDVCVCVCDASFQES